MDVSSSQGWLGFVNGPWLLLQDVPDVQSTPKQAPTLPEDILTLTLPLTLTLNLTLTLLEDVPARMPSARPLSKG